MIGIENLKHTNRVFSKLGIYLDDIVEEIMDNLNFGDYAVIQRPFVFGLPVMWLRQESRLET